MAKKPPRTEEHKKHISEALRDNKNYENNTKKETI